MTGLGGGLTFLVFAVGAGAVAVIYTTVAFGNAAMLVLGFPLGFFAAGVFSAMGPFFTEHFPYCVRRRGIDPGASPTISAGPPAHCFRLWWASLSARIPLGHAIGLFAGVGYATMALAAFLLLLETRGKVLRGVTALPGPRGTDHRLLWSVVLGLGDRRQKPIVCPTSNTP